MGVPALDTQVLRLDGDQQPGDLGAALLDAHDQDGRAGAWCGWHHPAGPARAQLLEQRGFRGRAAGGRCGLALGLHHAGNQEQQKGTKSSVSRGKPSA